ncbi:MAG: hypothetical protein FWD74_11605, partial [Actinomycetia bacterium]|nr:hypothetical protein [Actinomycetes bacterium]
MRLDDTKVTAHWLDSAAVSRAAGRAHRRRFGLATVAAAVLAAAIVVPLTVPGSSPRPVAGPGATSPAGAPAPVTGDGVRVAARLAGGVQLMAADRPTSAPDPTAIDPLATAEQQFTLALLDQLGAGGTADGGNM